MKKVIVLIMALLSVFTLSACQKNYENIDNNQLREMLANPDDYQFVDVRTSQEYYDSHIPGFVTVIDYYILEDDYSLIENYDLDKDIPVVIMCNSGNRSVSASNIFHDQGFTTIYNLTDGIQGWDGDTE